MTRFVVGDESSQSSLFPERLDDYLGEDDPDCRAIDVFVDELDLADLGFGGVEPEVTEGRAYHPATLLKIYVYGYLNRVQSSRRLKRCQSSDYELVWLTGRLMPDFKTIADFRKDNGEAIRKVCREFVVLCRRLELFSEASVAIDGSKFKAVNTRDRNFTQAKMQRRLAQIDESIARYLSQLDSADRQGEAVPEAKITRLNEKIATLREEVQRLNGLNPLMMQTEDKQISLTDPDARSMATSGRGSGMVGYNVQSAVDTKHHLIVTHEVTNVGSDRSQLSRMSEQARAAIGSKAIEAVADRGYYNGEEIVACEQAGVTVYLPKPMTSGLLARGRFGKQDFVYVAADDIYLCPAGERLTRKYRLPCLVMLPSRSLPPVVCCLGTNPIQAARLRPDENAFQSPISATRAVATSGPMPGISASRGSPRTSDAKPGCSCRWIRSRLRWRHTAAPAHRECRGRLQEGGYPHHPR